MAATISLPLRKPYRIAIQGAIAVVLIIDVLHWLRPEILPRPLDTLLIWAWVGVALLLPFTVARRADAWWGIGISAMFLLWTMHDAAALYWTPVAADRIEEIGGLAVLPIWFFIIYKWAVARSRQLHRDQAARPDQA